MELVEGTEVGKAEAEAGGSLGREVGVLLGVALGVGARVGFGVIGAVGLGLKYIAQSCSQIARKAATSQFIPVGQPATGGQTSSA